MNKRTLKKVKASNLPKPVLGGYKKGLSSLSEFAVNKIIENIEAGLSISKSYRSLGISDKNFHDWMRKGEDDFRHNETLRGLKVDPKSLNVSIEQFLFLEVTKATNEIEKEMVGSIREAAKKGEWQAAKWYLSKVNKESFGDEKEQTSQTTNNNLIVVPATPPSIGDWAKQVADYQQAKVLDEEKKKIEDARPVDVRIIEESENEQT